MGTRGPAPQPTALRLVRGGHPERINRDEPVPAALEVLPPKGMCKVARAMWDKYAPDLADKGVLTAWDVDTFAEGCEWWADYKAAQARARKVGATIPGTRGTLVKNPDVDVAKHAFDEAMKVFSRFGMTPSDRAQLHVGGSRRRDDVDRLLS